MSDLPTLTILPDEQKFNGENLIQWKINIAQILGSKGLQGYVDGTIPKPSPPKPTPPPDTEKAAAHAVAATPVYSSTPTLDEWVFRDQHAREHVTLNCTDITSLGVVTDGTAKDAWDSIIAEWSKNTEMRRSYAQDALNKTLFVEGSDIQEHIKVLRTRRAAVDGLSTAPMSDETWRGIIVRSIPPTPKWLPVIPCLYAVTTSAEIFSMLITHGIILGRDSSQKSSSQSNTALATKSTASCANPNCKARKRSTHTTENCYWLGGHWCWGWLINGGDREVKVWWISRRGCPRRQYPAKWARE